MNQRSRLLVRALAFGFVVLFFETKYVVLADMEVTTILLPLPVCQHTCLTTILRAPQRGEAICPSMHSRQTAGPLPYPTLYLPSTPESNTPSKWERAPTTAQTVVTTSNVQKRETEAVGRQQAKQGHQGEEWQCERVLDQRGPEETEVRPHT